MHGGGGKVANPLPETSPTNNPLPANAGFLRNIPLNATTLSLRTQRARTAAALLTLGLFTVGSIPTSGHAFRGAMHWVARVAAYALIAFAFGLSWPQRPVVQITAFVGMIGVINEVTEIITHSQAFETEDAVVNGIGALIGAAIQSVIVQ